jgi:hypothetical protein
MTLKYFALNVGSLAGPSNGPSFRARYRCPASHSEPDKLGRFRRCEIDLDRLGRMLTAGPRLKDPWQGTIVGYPLGEMDRDSMGRDSNETFLRPLRPPVYQVSYVP